MPPTTAVATGRLLLGNEAVAQAAYDSGISAAYGYPGTPSTEILETLAAITGPEHTRRVSWCANEKTAYEAALGASLAGQRVIVAMKHVGLNVAADPFMNSALLAIRGGLVLAVADDPGMHSSQNEQDSRLYADFARIPCLEPSDPQEAYEMTREAFDLSERFRIPVMLRLVTRLSHSRAGVVPGEPRRENPPSLESDPARWVLLPANARKRWRHLLDLQGELSAATDSSAWSPLALSDDDDGLGVITTGTARNYYFEALGDLDVRPSHLHIGAYPLPVERIRQLAEHCERILVVEQGYPFVERALRGVLPGRLEIRGRMSGPLPQDGELTPDLLRAALGLAPHAHETELPLAPPVRPPQLCAGCPHRDAYEALDRALAGFDRRLVTSDIGCYTLGVLPPISLGDSCVCMGASIGMAKGAADAGLHPVVAVIGDGTFFHSGLTPLLDAIHDDTNMTVVILDNETTAMTGVQPTIVGSSQIREVIVGAGVDPEHCVVLDAHPRKVDTIAEVMRREIEHPGLSVVVCVRECLEAARKRKAGAR